MDYKKIVWIASYPKSGNTWVRCFLEAYFRGILDINDIQTSVADTAAFRCHTGNGDDPSEFPEEIQNLVRPMGLVRLVQKYNEDVENGYKFPLFVKTHNGHLVANGGELLPQPLTKSIIYIVRDPRDVAISYAKHMGSSIDDAIKAMGINNQMLADTRGGALVDYLSDWSTHVMSFARSQAHDVRIVFYEDLSADPVNTFSEILEHINIDPDQEAVRKAVELTKFEKLKTAEEAEGFVEKSNKSEKFFNSGKSTWRKVLTDTQADILESTHAQVMDFLGYGRRNQSQSQNAIQARKV